MPITTELDAINILLAAIGTSPVNNLNTANTDAVMAKNYINNALKEIQTEKWYFNTEENYQLTPDINGEIHLADNIINIDSIGRFGENTNLIPRGKKLYDRLNHTYKIPQPITANIILCLEFDELPETAIQYIIAKAARKYQEELLGDPSLRTWTKEDEATARGRLIDEDLRIRKLSFGALPKQDPTILMDFRNI